MAFAPRVPGHDEHRLGPVPDLQGGGRGRTARGTIGSVNRTDTIDGFSSRGPSDAMTLKPEIVAHGFEIMSDNPAMFGVDGAQYRMLGTSTAAPHVAGAAALLAQARPEQTRTNATRTVRLRDGRAEVLLPPLVRPGAYTVTGRHGGTEDLPASEGSTDVKVRRAPETLIRSKGGQEVGHIRPAS